MLVLANVMFPSIAFTLSVAAKLLVEPVVLVTTTEYVPALFVWTLLMVYEELVAPAITFVLLNIH